MKSILVQVKQFSELVHQCSMSLDQMGHEIVNTQASMESREGMLSEGTKIYVLKLKNISDSIISFKLTK